MSNEIQEYREEYHYSSDFAKSNVLINARYSAGLLDNQLLALSLQRVYKNGNRYEAVIPVNQIRKLLGKEYHEFYTHLKAAALRLLKCNIMLEDPEKKKFIAYNLFGSCASENGDFKAVFNPDLKNYIVNLQSNFTVLSIEEMVKLESVQSFRLYEILKSRTYYRKNFKGEKSGKFRVEFNINEFRVLLSAVNLNHPEISKLINQKENPDYDKIIELAERLHMEDVEKGKKKSETFPAPKWARWQHLKDKVIIPACEEISEKTDIFVDYAVGKGGKGGKVKSIIFYVENKNLKESEPAEVKDIDDLIDEVMSYIDEKIKLKDVKNMLNAADNDVNKIKKAYDISKTQDVDNLVGFIISAIKNDYSEPVKSKKKKDNAFRFSNERDYDYDELEELLLNK